MNHAAAFLFLLQIASTFFMIGLIWFVQIVHYPLFSRTGRAEFGAYEKAHTTLTTCVVAPIMLVELTTAIVMFWLRPTGVSTLQCTAGLALVGVIWISTALLQVPCHRSLASGFDAKTHERLVLSNWLRTIAWSVRGVLLVAMACGVLGI